MVAHQTPANLAYTQSALAELIVYFAILVSDCKLMVEEPNLNIVVVKDYDLGTNDCRGWVRESLYRKLKIGTNRFCQFRLAFDTREPKQAKGALKAMSDRVADKLGVDIILPESACKPSLKGGVRFLPQLGISGRMYAGPAILGIKELSRVSEFGSSYTLIEHASDEALQFEIMLRAIERIRKVRKAWDESDYESLFEVIGKSEVATFDEDASFDPDELEQESSPVSEGVDPAEAVLLADRSGTSIKFPYVANQLNRKLARWAFRTCTGGDLKLPSFALADDGVLIEYRGKILSASDWIPQDTSITSLTAEEGLCIRYPERTASLEVLNDRILAALSQLLFNQALPEVAQADPTPSASLRERVQELLDHLVMKNPHFAFCIAHKEADGAALDGSIRETDLRLWLGSNSKDDVAFTLAMGELGELLLFFRDRNLSLPKYMFERSWFLHLLHEPERMLQTRALLNTLTAEIEACASV
jgi:hypothetical protein